MHIIIASAYSLQSQKGNAISAKRIADLLAKAGHTTQALCSETLPSCDALIALHATKTLHLSRSFRQHNPTGKLIIYLTGTDLYRELPAGNPDFFEALELADSLVVSQPSSLDSVPRAYRSKTHVVPASVQLPEISPHAPLPQPSIALIGHLRTVKNPFLLNHALSLLPDLDIHAYSIGEAREASMERSAHHWEKREPRYSWLGNMSHGETLGWVQKVTLTINSSHLEGGSNAVAESIVLGTPVLASRIEGNIGMLGDDYAGYFQPNSATDLAKVLQRCCDDPTFLQQLRDQVSARQEMFSTSSETQGWLKLL